jgi:hypothetical protein
MVDRIRKANVFLAVEQRTPSARDARLGTSGKDPAVALDDPPGAVVTFRGN